MAPLELPGRPNNLTEEQKVKLKEMWGTAFKVFGVPLDVESESATATEVPTPTEGVARTVTEATEAATEPQPKKGGGKIKSLFKKKDKAEASTSGSSTPTAAATPDLSQSISQFVISESDDKYSQTKEFKDLLATSTPQEIQDTFWRMVKCDHPDSLFLRFLRARKWDVPKAIVMFVATLRWRSKELDVRPLIEAMLIVG